MCVFPLIFIATNSYKQKEGIIHLTALLLNESLKLANISVAANSCLECTERLPLHCVRKLRSLKVSSKPSNLFPVSGHY